MLSLRRPSTETIRKFLEVQSKLGLTYTAIGATAAVPPADSKASDAETDAAQNVASASA
jgi:hypothetical protein